MPILDVLGRQIGGVMTSEEFYKIIKERHAKVDWSNRASIHKYNEFVRELRKLVTEKQK